MMRLDVQRQLLPAWAVVAVFVEPLGPADLVRNVRGPMTPAKPDLATALSAGLLAIVFALFLWPQLAFAIRIGLCCGDDSFFATVALTLARTGTYAFPTSSSEAHLFDPLISAGPTLLLPGALVLKLFGPDPRLPGLTALGLALLPLALVFVLLLRRFAAVSVCLYAVVVLVGIATFTFSTNLGIFLGEGAMMALIVLGAVLLASPEAAPRSLVAGGICFGLAVLSKHMGSFAVLGACLAFAGLAVRRRGFAALPQIGLVVASVLILPILFECIKWAALGSAAYLDHWTTYLGFERRIHAAAEIGFPDFLRLLADNFPSAAGAAVAVLTALGLLATARGEDGRNAATLGLLLAAAILFHLAYFALSGASNQRYLWLAIMLVAFLLALPILTLRGWRQAAFMIFLGIVALPLHVVAGGYREQHRWIANHAGAAEREAVMGFLGQHPSLPVYGLNWASALDVFFLLPEGREWRLSDDAAEVGAREAIYVSLDQFAQKDRADYRRLLAQCERQVAELAIYSVFHCRAGAPSPADPVSPPLR